MYYIDFLFTHNSVYVSRERERETERVRELLCVGSVIC